MSRLIHGSGACPSDYMLVGSAPGYEEANKGRVFCGKTGAELRRYLDGEGLPEWDEWFLTNLHREYKGKDVPYTSEDTLLGGEHLRRELGRVRPKHIVTLGRESARWFLGDVDMEDCNAIPWYVTICPSCKLHIYSESSSNTFERRQAAGYGLEVTPAEDMDARMSLGGERQPTLPRIVSSKVRSRTGKSSTTHALIVRVSTQNTSKQSHKRKTSDDSTCFKHTVNGEDTPSRETISIRLHNIQHSGSVENVCGNLQTDGKLCTCEVGHALRDVVVFPIYHVASGFHSPELASHVTYGFSQLADYFTGRLHARKLYDDPIPQPHYEEISTVARLGEVLQGFRQTDADGRAAPIAIDTEGYPGEVWSLQFSLEPGRGYLISASNSSVLRAFGDFLHRVRPRLVYHSGLHDIGRMRELGLPTDLDFDDTMESAYLLQIEPQGLKPLCVRHCNMRMQSYDDVVGDAQQRIALDYMQGIWDIEEMEYEERCQDAFWADVEKGRRISKVPKLPKTALHKAAQRCLASKDTYRLWHDQLDDIQVGGYRHLGSIPRATLDHVERDRAVAYGCRDSDGTLRLAPELSQRVSSLELRDVYRLDLATYPIIERMSYIGLKPDLKHFERMSGILAKEIEALKGRLIEHTGNPDFNANGGDQVSEYLFGTLGLEGVKWLHKSQRYSSDDKILEALEHEYPEYPIIGDIRDYRSTYKLKHTFVDRLPDFVRRWPHDGRIHATFRATRVVTGRLASADPNLYAQPKDAEDTAPEREFRRGWVADDGHVIISHDLSQIELRVGAHLSQDPYMLKVFRGEVRNPDGSMIDLHAGLGQRIYGLAKKDQTKAQRTAMKCFHPDTEVLTKTGWKQILSLVEGEEVIQAWPLENGRTLMEWAAPLGVHSEYRHENLVHFYNKSMDLRVTSDHLMLGWGGTGKPFLEWPDRFAKRAHTWANAGELGGSPEGKQASAVMLRLAVASQADGHITSDGAMTFGFTKERKIARLKSLLDEAQLPFTLHIQTNGVTRFRLSRSYAERVLRLLDSDKTLPWGWLRYPIGLRKIILEEVVYWDSHQAENWTHYAYSSSLRKNIDVLQAIASVTNLKSRAALSVEAHGNHSDQWVLSVKDHGVSRGGSLVALYEPFEGEVACLSVPSGFVLVRDRGVPVVVKQSINFGFWMGQTAKGLMVELRRNGVFVTEDDAQRWLDEANALYAGAQPFKDACIAEAERNGYIRCMSGRIRYIGGIRSRDERIRSEAERFSFSTKIQEGAQYIGRTALAWIWKNVIVEAHKRGDWVEPLLWVHDDFVCESEERLARSLHVELEYAMTKTFRGLSVPIETSGDFGRTWAASDMRSF